MYYSESCTLLFSRIYSPFLADSLGRRARRSGLLTTVMQVASRIIMVWYICENYPQVSSPSSLQSNRAEMGMTGCCVPCVRVHGLCVVLYRGRAIYSLRNRIVEHQTQRARMAPVRSFAPSLCASLTRVGVDTRPFTSSTRSELDLRERSFINPPSQSFVLSLPSSY